MYGYCILYQRVEEEEYGGTWELLKEGFMTSFALFLVSQSFVYTVNVLYKHCFIVVIYTGSLDYCIHCTTSQLIYLCMYYAVSPLCCIVIFCLNKCDAIRLKYNKYIIIYNQTFQYIRLSSIL